MDLIAGIQHKFREAKKIAGLGANLISKLKLFFVYFYLTPRNFLRRRFEMEVEVKIKRFNQQFNFIVSNENELALLREIFLREEYKMNLDSPPKVIFDLGANVGLSVIYFKLKYPGSRVYAFEPYPKLFRKLKEDTSVFKGVSVFDFAISDSDGVAKFFVFPQRTLSSSLLERERGQDYILCKTRMLDTIIRNLNIPRIDLLKFDIEGSEYNVFKAFKGLDKVDYVIGEVHLDLIPVSREEFLSIFKRRGFILRIEELSSSRFMLRAANKRLRTSRYLE